MCNVTNLDEMRPHVAGRAFCLECGCEWMAVYPEAAKELECPRCKRYTEIKVYPGDIEPLDHFGGRGPDLPST